MTKTDKQKRCGLG